MITESELLILNELLTISMPKKTNVRFVEM